MGETRELIKIYSTILDDVFKSFGIKNGFGEIVDNTEAKWFYNGEVSTIMKKTANTVMKVVRSVV